MRDKGLKQPVLRVIREDLCQATAAISVSLTLLNTGGEEERLVQLADTQSLLLQGFITWNSAVKYCSLLLHG
jgi:hypothetical protein